MNALPVAVLVVVVIAVFMWDQPDDDQKEDIYGKSDR